MRASFSPLARINHHPGGPPETSGSGGGNSKRTPVQKAHIVLNKLIDEVNQKYGTRISIFDESLGPFLEAFDIKTINLTTRDIHGFELIASFVEGEESGKAVLQQILDQLPETNAPLVKLMVLKMFHEDTHHFANINDLSDRPPPGTRRLVDCGKLQRDKQGFPTLSSLKEAIAGQPEKLPLINAINIFDVTKKINKGAFCSLRMIKRVVLERYKKHLASLVSATTVSDTNKITAFKNRFITGADTTTLDKITIEAPLEDFPYYDFELNDSGGVIDLTLQEVVIVPWLPPTPPAKPLFSKNPKPDWGPASIIATLSEAKYMVRTIGNGIFGTQPSAIEIESPEHGQQRLKAIFRAIN